MTTSRRIAITAVVLGIAGAVWALRRDAAGDATRERAAVLARAAVQAGDGADALAIAGATSTRRVSITPRPFRELDGPASRVDAAAAAADGTGSPAGESRAAAQLLASGIVVDDHERPLAGARIEVGVSHAPATGGAARMQRHMELDVVTGADGLFEILSAVAAGRVHLGAQLDGQGTAVAEVPAGTTNVRIVIVTPGAIRVSVVVADGPAPEIHARATRHTSTAPATWPRIPIAHGRGSVTLSGLAPGDYAVSIIAGGNPLASPLLTIDDVHVAAGVTTEDRRLADIDLRELMAVLVVEAVGPDGNPLDQGVVGFGAGNERQYFAIEGGRCVIPLKERAVDIEVRARGLRTVEIPHASGTVNVQMKPALTVTVGLPSSLTPASDDFRLVVAGAQREKLEDAATFSDDGHATLTLLRAGRRDFRLCALPRGARLIMPRPVAGYPLFTIDVADGDAPQTFTMPPPSTAAIEAVRHALAGTP